MRGKNLLLAADPARFPHPLALLCSLTDPTASTGPSIQFHLLLQELSSVLLLPCFGLLQKELLFARTPQEMS